jgi:ribosome biogenesis protein ERB1
MTVRLWEVETGRCMNTWNFDNIIYSVTWNPNLERPIIAVAT